MNFDELAAMLPCTSMISTVLPPYSSVMRRCIFMTIQLSHTLVERETRFYVAWQLQTTIRCRLFGQRKIGTLLSGHPNGDTQVLNLRNVPFAHKPRGVSV